MTFLAPWAVWALAGVPVIVLLYLLKLKRRPVTVSTLLFWQRVLLENRRRALFQKLRHLLSLLLHLLIFLLIIAALARPALDRLVREGASVVLVLDTRARMQAIEENGESRFERARREARWFAREAGPGRQFCLLSAGASPRVVVPFTNDERDLLRGLESLSPSDATGDLDAARRLADSLLAARQGDKQIVAFTERGTPRDNVAITRFATRPLLNSPQTSEVLLAMRNFGRDAVSGNVEIALDGRLLDVKPFTLAPGEERLEIFPSVPRTTRAARGWLTAKLDTSDALALDNVAYAVLPAPQPVRVLLVSRGNWFVEKLLAADQQAKFELVAPDAWQSDFATKFDVIIFDRFIPAGFDLATATGNVLFLKESPFTAPGAAVDQPLISDMDAAHPALRLVNLQNVTIVRAAPSQLPHSAHGWRWEAPLRSFDHPLLILGERRAQRMAALTFDLAESDLPLRVAFPLLMANTLRWLAGEGLENVVSVRAGETLPLAPGASIATKPRTTIETGPGEAALATGSFQPLQNGYYLMTQASGASWLAVNTFSAKESDLREAAPTADAVPAMVSGPLAIFTGWPLWQTLALAALLLCTLEWWLFHRRRTE